MSGRLSRLAGRARPLDLFKAVLVLPVLFALALPQLSPARTAAAWALLAAAFAAAAALRRPLAARLVFFERTVRGAPLALLASLVLLRQPLQTSAWALGLAAALVGAFLGAYFWALSEPEA